MLNLITDRTASDVANRTEKGHYNANDLNRVTAAMEYLDAELRKVGYESGYSRLKIPRPDIPGESRLPEGYIELEYIESTGTQYIDTGFMPDSETSIDIDISILGYTKAGSGVFGSRDASGGPSFVLWVMSNNQFRSDYGDSGKTKFIAMETIGNFRIKQSQNSIEVNETTLTFDKSDFYVSYSALLFAANSSGKVANGYVIGKVRSFKIYSGEVLKRNYIPCKNSSGDVGMYDVEGNKFYGNAGTGKFTAGPEATPPSIPNPLDPYTWYPSDIPTRKQMQQYLDNVKKIRSTLLMLESTPVAPESVRFLDYEKANNIEKILIDVETAITNMLRSIDLGWALGISHIGLYGGV